MENKGVKLINKTITYGYSIVFLLFAINMIFFSESYWKEFSTNTVKVMLFSVAFLVIQWLYLKIIDKVGGKKAVVSRIMLVLGLGAVQFYLFWKTAVPFGWDTLPIRDVATSGFTDMLYFAKWPNNLFPAIIGRIWVKLLSPFSFISPLRSLVILNIVCIDSGIFLDYLCAKKIANQKLADRFLITALPLIAFSPWVAVYYTDTIAVPFVALTLYCLICAAQSEKTKQRVFMFLAGVFCVIGSAIKITVCIICIAALIVCILYKKQAALYEKIMPWAIFSAGLVMGFLAVQALEYYPHKLINQTMPNIKARGFYYFLQTGIQYEGLGNWSGEVFDWTTEHINDEDYDEKARAMYVAKLKEYGPYRFSRHLYNKLMWSGVDGTFMYGGEGDFYHEAQNPQDTLKGKLQNYIYKYSPFYQKWLTQWLQGVWLVVCVQSALSFLSKDKNKIILMCKLAIGGLWLFLMLFENRSRYVFLYLPVIILVAQYSFENIKLKIPSKKEKITV